MRWFCFLLPVRVWLLLCISICGSDVSAKWFSSRVVRCLLLHVSASVGNALAFVLMLTCQPNPVLVEKRRRMLMQEEMPMKPLGMDALKVPLRPQVNVNASH